MEIMLTIKILALGVLQGIAEILPVSSSGHLVLVKHILGVDSPGMALEIALHTGTLAAILLYYRRTIAGLVAGFLKGEAESRRMVGLLIVGTIPAGLIGIGFKHRIDAMAESPALVAGALIVTGLLLLSLRFATRRTRTLGLPAALITGIAQAVAIAPAISRSGATIVAARHLGISPVAAAEFSFLLSIPAIAGATLVEVLDGSMASMTAIPLPLVCAGACVAGVTGYFALTGLVRLLRTDHLWWFGFYCAAVGGLALLLG